MDCVRVLESHSALSNSARKNRHFFVFLPSLSVIYLCHPVFDCLLVPWWQSQLATNAASLACRGKGKEEVAAFEEFKKYLERSLDTYLTHVQHLSDHNRAVAGFWTTSTPTLF